MNRARLVVQWVTLLAILSSRIGVAQCGDCGDRLSDPLCGPKCLLEVCARLGVTTDLDELAGLCDMDESGTTMAGLQKAAQRKGLHAVGVKMSLSELADCSAAAICYLWGNHFVVVHSDAGGLEVINPSASEPDQAISGEDFEALYSGFALLVSREAVALPRIDARRPDLRFETYSHDLGILDEGTKIERALGFRNVGEQHLVTSQVRPSCTCLKAELVNKTVPPGGRGSIALTFDATGLRGVQRHALYVESNDPVSPLVQIRVAAAIKPAKLLVSTRRIHFGEVDANLGAQREIFIKDPGDGSLEVEEVVSDSGLLDVCLVGASRPEEGDTVFPVRLTLKPGVPVGAFEAGITIISNHPKEPRLQIPVFARIKGDIEVSPEVLFLGFVTIGQSASKSVTLRACTARVFAIESLCTSSDFFSVEISPKDPGREYAATVSLKATAPAGFVECEVHFHTDSPLQPEITVPVHALVEDPESTTARQPSDEPVRDQTAASPVVRVYVFRSEGCAHCQVADNANLQAIAAKVGCGVEVRYFDVESMANWQELTDLEKKYHDTDNEMPAVFVGSVALGGEQEVAEGLERAIAMYAAEGGTAWPDEIDDGS